MLESPSPESSQQDPRAPRASRRVRRELGSLVALLLFATGMAMACSSESQSRSDDDDGGSGGSAGNAGRGGAGGSAGSDECEECITQTECGTEWDRCEANSACRSLPSCYEACEDAACISECDADFPAGVTDWYAVVTCSALKCAEPCELGSGGTSGTGGTSATCVPPTDNGVCDTFPRVCGCTATQNCTFDFDTKDSVCTPTGTTPPDARCTGDTCTKGHGCVGGTCRPYCETNTACEGSPFRRCIQVSDEGTPVVGYKVCSQHCDLRDPANTARNPAFGACGAGANCVLIDLDEGTTSCFGTSGPPRSPCTDSGDCAIGYGCSTNDTCQKWCRVGVNADCASTPATPVCGGFGTRLHVLSGADGGRTEYGFCIARTADGGVGPAPDAGTDTP